MLVNDFVLNALSGLGTEKDKFAGGKFTLRLLTKADLDAMYRGDWIARKIVDIVPQDMTREWRAWQARGSQIEKVEGLERTLRLREKVAAALKQARHYGGAALFLGIADQNPSMPLDFDTVATGALRYVHVLSRFELTPSDLVRDPISAFFGEPSTYQISSGDGRSATIHPSRIIRFSGMPLPDRSTVADCWDDSILQVVYDAVQGASGALQHVVSMLPEAKLDVISVPGLSAAMSTQEGAARVASRFGAANTIKSMFNMLLVEGGEKEGETWQQKQLNFSQFPDLLRTYLQVAAGAADIPVTRMLGQSPAGMNATGESDLRNYYDNVSSQQEINLRPSLDRLDEVLIRSALGKRPANIWYEWRPLWQLSEKEEAEIALRHAEAADIYARNNGVPAAVLRRAIQNQLVEHGTYPGIEAAYAEYEAGMLKAPTDQPLAPNTKPLITTTAKSVAAEESART